MTAHLTHQRLTQAIETGLPVTLSADEAREFREYTDACMLAADQAEHMTDRIAALEETVKALDAVVTRMKLQMMVFRCGINPGDGKHIIWRDEN